MKNCAIGTQGNNWLALSVERDILLIDFEQLCSTANLVLVYIWYLGKIRPVVAKIFHFVAFIKIGLVKV